MTKLTIEIESPFHKELKRYALEHDTSVRAIIETGARYVLQNAVKPPSRGQVPDAEPPQRPA